MTISIPPAHAGRITTALAQARAGEAAAATGSLKSLLRDLGREPSHLRAAVEYALAYAANEDGATGQASRAAAGCQSVGLALEEPGWVALGCAARATAVLAAGRPADAVSDLVRAEYELRQSDDDGLRAWVHGHLGQAYERFGLFELAVPHYEEVLQIEERTLPLPAPRAYDALSLATVNFHWVKELEMLMDPSCAAEIDERRSEQALWAERAMELADGDPAAEAVLSLARFLRAAAAWPQDPARWIGELHRCRSTLAGHGYIGYEREATALLAVAHVEVGEVAEAQRAARLALLALEDDSDLTTQRYVRWATLRVADAMGYPSASAGLGYGRSVSWAWRDQHRSDLEMMRAAIAGYERSRAHDDAVRAAREDPLTGLGNRRAFDEWLVGAGEEPISLILVDVDELKHLNDTHGHVLGDQALRVVADLIATNVRSGDRAARVGGDEFAIVLASPDVSEAELVMDRLQLAASVAVLPAEGTDCRLGLSMGLASTQEGLGSMELLAVADRRMYVDKRRRVDESTEDGGAVA